MSRKECGHEEGERRKVVRLVLIGGGVLILVILILIFLVWLILRPSKPHFTLQDATLYTFNISSSSTIPNTLSFTMQATISAHNPNARIGVYYHSLRVSLSYRAQQISLPTALPDTYQGHRDFTLWSPFLFANAAPLAPFLLSSLLRDRDSGTLPFNVKVNAKVNWKVATWISAKYHLYVNCPAYFTFPADPTNAAGMLPSPLNFHIFQTCTVDV